MVFILTIMAIWITATVWAYTSRDRNAYDCAAYIFVCLASWIILELYRKNVIQA
jgi:cbb3-type cytochrome oxidase subunit 3